MFRRGLPLLFAVMMLACPLVCSAGALCSPSVRDTKQCCSCCCHQNGPAAPDRQERPSREKGDGCQCICGGAVQCEGALTILARHAAQFVGIVDFDFNVVVPVAERTAMSAYFPDVGWFPSGRDLCCLHMSFLC